MPSTINGIGTWYYGKSNLFEIDGVCEHCGAETRLASFDTTEYFVVVFIPIIPLKKLRILNQCPSCTRHTFLKLSDWETQKATTIEEMRMKFVDSPDDPEVAKELLQVFHVFQAPELFNKLAPTILEYQSGNLEVIQLMTAIFGLYGNDAKVLELAQMANQLEDNEETRILLAQAYMDIGKPDDAAPLIEHVLKEKDVEKLYLPFSLAKAYQEKGDHKRALELMKGCLDVLPELADEKSFKKSMKLSEKHLMTGKPIVAKKRSTGLKASGEEANVSGKLAKLVLPAIIIGLLSIWAAVSFVQASTRTVYLVSGLPKPYRVSVGDQEIQLNPGQVKPVDLGEGTFQVKSLSDFLMVEPYEVTIKTTPMMRIFSDESFVINPDQIAVIYRETIYYSENPTGSNPPPTLHAGKGFYSFEDIDYDFSSFPDTIELPSSSSRVAKVGLNRLDIKKYDPIAMIGIIASQCGQEASLKAAIRFMDVTQSDVLVSYVCSVLSTEVACKTLEKRLDRTPVDMAVHRAYQHMKSKVNPDFDMEENYRKRLAANPKSGQLKYLYARVCKDQETQRKLFMESASADPPCSYAVNALSFDRLGCGDGDKALSFSRRALEMAPDRIHFQRNHLMALMCAGKLTDAKTFCEKHLNDRLGFIWQHHLLDVLVQMNNLSEAKENITRWSSDDKGKLDKKTAENLNRQLRYLRGDWTGYANSPCEADDTLELFRSKLVSEAYDDTVETLGSLPDDSLKEQLALLVSLMAKRHSKASEVRTALIELFAKGDYVSRELAEMLKANAVSMEAVENIAMEPTEKALLLTYLGLANQMPRATALARARKLHFSRQFPAHVLDGVLAQRKRVR